MSKTALRSLLSVALLLGTVGQASAQADALAAPSGPAPDSPPEEIAPQAAPVPEPAPPVQPAPEAAPAPSPSAIRPVAPTPAGTVQVHVEANHPEVVLHHTSGGTLEPGQSLMLVPGVHRFGVSVNGSRPIEVDPLVIDRPGLIRANYLRRSGTRSTGWALFGIGTPLAILGAVGGGAGWASGNVFGAIMGLGAFIAGGINLILALAVGLPLATVGDGARIRFE